MSKILSRREVFRGKVVRVESVDLDFDGTAATFELINFNSVTGVSALPIDDDGKLVLIRHFQLGIADVGWSLPTGGLMEGEEPDARMQLELQEEIGYKAQKLTLMTRLHALPGYIGSEAGYIFLAEGLIPSKQTGDETFAIEVVHLPFATVLSMVRNGEIMDGRTMLAVLYYEKFYKRKYGRTTK